MPASPGVRGGVVNAGAGTLRAQCRCDVLVIGGGPAGSAAARSLSQQGLRVVLADRHTFPRDKVCGDGLIGDALSSLTLLGLRERVEQLAARPPELRVQPPGAPSAAIRGSFLCMPRRAFDLLLWNAAQETGAECRPALAAVGPLESNGRVTGARFQSPSGDVDIPATVTLLATGASQTTLEAFGVGGCTRPSAVAGRAYFEAPMDLAAEHRGLLIAYDRNWCPGYGWIFPGPGNLFNVGVGLFTRRSSPRRLREFWQVFTTRFAPAAAIVRASKPAGPFRGAPLRTGLEGAAFGRPGMLVVGEAAATTYSATGEGIGKAMESALLAAEVAAECVAGRRELDTAHDWYAREFRRRFSGRYRAYAIAERWAAHPRLLDLLAVRARRSRFAKRELEALIAERGDARRLFSTMGLLRALVR
jgi:geranylgeranyl reductase family protein